MNNLHLHQFGGGSRQQHNQHRHQVIAANSNDLDEFLLLEQQLEDMTMTSRCIFFK